MLNGTEVRRPCLKVKHNVPITDLCHLCIVGCWMLDESCFQNTSGVVYYWNGEMIKNIFNANEKNGSSASDMAKQFLL